MTDQPLPQQIQVIDNPVHGRVTVDKFGRIPGLINRSVQHPAPYPNGANSME